MKTIHPRIAILLALDAFGGDVCGKTLLQKRLYFLEELIQRQHKLSPGFEFDAHYYGPYSSVVSSEMTSLVLSGMVREESASFGISPTTGFEHRRYRYQLTHAGGEALDWLKQHCAEEARYVQNAVAEIRSAGELDYMGLSVAAKAHWILKHARQPLTAKAIAREAARFGWQVSEAQTQSAIQFLEKLGLIADAPANSLQTTVAGHDPGTTRRTHPAAASGPGPLPGIGAHPVSD